MLIASLAIALAAPAPAIDGSQVIAHTVAVYRRLNSYYDQGTISEYVVEGGRRVTAWPRTEFRAWYRRPGTLRLQARDIDRAKRLPECVLWPTGSGTYGVWSPWSGVSKLKLPQALGATPARIGDFVDTVFSQVDPKAAGTEPLLPLVEPRVVGQQVVDGRACDVVRGESERTSDVTLWIDQRSHLIRQLRIGLEGGRRETVVRLRPLANPTFAPGTFSFRPPQ